jgi:hypothetical protein
VRSINYLRRQGLLRAVTIGEVGAADLRGLKSRDLPERVNLPQPLIYVVPTGEG